MTGEPADAAAWAAAIRAGRPAISDPAGGGPARSLAWSCRAGPGSHGRLPRAGGEGGQVVKGDRYGAITTNTGRLPTLMSLPALLVAVLIGVTVSPDPPLEWAT